MGSIDVFKPLSTVLSRAVNESLLHQIIFGNAENQTQGAIHCAMRPPGFLKIHSQQDKLNQLWGENLFCSWTILSKNFLNHNPTGETNLHYNLIQFLKIRNAQLCCERNVQQKIFGSMQPKKIFPQKSGKGQKNNSHLKLWWLSPTVHGERIVFRIHAQLVISS